MSQDIKDIEQWNLFKFLIKKCIAHDQELIKDFALHLCDNAVIATEQRKKIYTHVKEGFCVEAVELMFDSIVQLHGSLWKSMLLVALYEEDCPGDKNMIAILKKLMELFPLRPKLFLFINKWDKLIEMHEKIHSLWILGWPEEEETGIEWPYAMLMKCIEKDNDETRKFMNDVESIIEDSIRMEVDDAKMKSEISDNKEPSPENEREPESSDHHERLEAALRCILQNCLVIDKEISDVALHFSDKDLISKGQRKKFAAHVKQGHFVEAVNYLVDAIIQHQPKLWLQMTLNCLKLDDCPGNKGMKKLLISSLEETRIDSDISFILNEWNLLSKLQDSILPLYKSVWPDEEENESWPLSVILKCVTANRENSRKFIVNMKSIISEAKIMEATEYTDKNLWTTVTTDKPVANSSDSATCTIPNKKSKSGHEDLSDSRKTQQSEVLSTQNDVKPDQDENPSTDLQITGLDAAAESNPRRTKESETYSVKNETDQENLQRQDAKMRKEESQSRRTSSPERKRKLIETNNKIEKSDGEHDKNSGGISIPLR